MRPQSIIWFERLYLAAFLFGIVSAVQTWSLQAAMLNSDPRLAAMPWVPYVRLAVGWAIVLALWYFVARRASVIAKWIVVALAAYGLILIALLLLAFLRGTAMIDVLVPSLAQNLLYIAAAAMLFRDDARVWFGEFDTDEPVAEDAA